MIRAKGVRLASAGNITAVLFEGNFEATLMLWEELIPHFCARHGRELFAVVPARDVFAVSGPEHLSELRDVVERIWPDGDHLLTREVFRRVGAVWEVSHDGC